MAISDSKISALKRDRFDRLTAADWYSAPSEDGRRESDRPHRLAAKSIRPFDARGRSTPHHFLVQLQHADLRPRFAEACRAFGDVMWCDDPSDMVARCGQAEVLAAVFDLLDGEGFSTAGAVAQVRAKRPDLPVVLWCERPEVGVEVGAHVAAGVSSIVFREETPLEERLLSALTGASDGAFQRLTDQALHRRVPAYLIPLFRYCLDNGAKLKTVADLAAGVSVGTKQLATQLRRAGMPPPSTILMWSKALIGAYRLERTADPVPVIADSLGFPSTPAFRRVLRRCANDSPTALREPGGFGWVLRCFERDVSKRSSRELPD